MQYLFPICQLVKSSIKSPQSGRPYNKTYTPQYAHRRFVLNRKSFSSYFNFKNWAFNQLQSFASGSPSFHLWGNFHSERIQNKKRIVFCNRWNYPYHIWSISAWHFKECIIYAVSQFIFFLYNNFTYEIFF